MKDVLSLHWRQLGRFGGAPGIRDARLEFVIGSLEAGEFEKTKLERWLRSNTGKSRP